MHRESIIFGISGAFFGVIVGWMIGTQQVVTPTPAAPPAATTATSTSATGGSSAPAPPKLDEGRAAEIQRVAAQNPRDAAPRIQLGNLYFDAERYNEAIRWYEEALQLDPRNPDVSTDLGVSYYYTNQPDRALAQFDRSLNMSPQHIKTMLNVGIVRAFGKQDLEGAMAAWQKVVDLAPDSPEGRAARQAIDSVKAAHPPASRQP